MPSFLPRDNKLIGNLNIGPHFGPKFVQQSVRQNKPISFDRPFNIPPPPDETKDLPRIVNYMADQGGCALWRIIWPSEYLNAYKKASVMNMFQLVVEPYFYATINAIKFQRQCQDNQVELIKHMKKISDAKKEKSGKPLKILWEVDDLVGPPECIPDFNHCKKAFNTPKIIENLKKLVDVVDEFVVVSDYMKEHYKQYVGMEKISVVPNYLPPTWLDNLFVADEKMKLYETNRNKPRIGYIGSGTHFDIANNNAQRDDFWHVIEFIHKTKDKYQWVFIGGYPVRFHSLVKSGVFEYHPWSPIIELQSKVRSLGLQATIAPLLDHPFNRAKSDIKLMESAALGIPCVCQNLNPYKEGIFKFDTGEEMLSQLENILKDEDSYENAMLRSRELVENKWLHNHLDEHLLIYNTEYGDPIRKNNDSFFLNNVSQFS